MAQLDVNMEDWQRAVKSQEYYDALADGRCLRWRDINTRPDDRSFIIGADINGSWLMRRCEPGQPSLSVFASFGATHWCEDMLGTPYVVVRTRETSGYLHIPG